MKQSVSCGVDIDEKLNNIIFKYNLDDVYPDYKKMLQAEKLAAELAKSWIGKGKIACIATYQSDIHRWKHFLRDDQDVEFIRCVKKFPVTSILDEFYDLEKKLGSKNWGKYSGVYILSLEGAAFIQRWLRMHGIEHLFIYDYFAIHELYFSHDWDTLLTDSAMEYWTYRFLDNLKNNNINIEVIQILEEWKKDKEPLVKEFHWKKAFFLALYIRDFILAEQLIEKAPSSCSQELCAWKEVTVLLGEIKAKLKSCHRRDILLLWTDAVPYEDIEKIQYLKEKMDTGICFDNMFSVNGYTNPTFKAIFCNKLPVDENSYSIERISTENSIVLRELKENGYKPVLIGGVWSAVPASIQSGKYHGKRTPASMILWDLWRNILLNSEPCFFLAHALIESHPPFLSVGVYDRILDDDGARYTASSEYLNRQYCYYLDILPKSMAKLYMTDHGKDEYQTKFHAFFVVENGEPHRHITEMCSYHDLFRLLHQVMKDEIIDEKKFSKEYIHVQELDHYMPVVNARIIKYHFPLHINYFGYHGVIDKDYIYLKFTNGIEWMAERGREGEEASLFSNRIDAPEEINKYRKMLGSIPELPPALQIKLRYAKYLQKAYKNALPRNLEKQRLLNEWVANYPRESLAIRTGGINAVGFYDMLSSDNRERIWCFIDRNPACMAAQRGLKVVKEIGDVSADVKGVVFVSYKFLEEMKKESLNYSSDIEILDAFEYLKNKGIVCKTGIAEYELTAEDCDVGFPFDEIDEEI